MYVSDSSIFPQTGLRVRITSMNGQDLITDLKNEMKIDELKIISLSHFSSPAESMKKSLYHRILLVRTGKVLSEEKTVLDEGIQNNGKCILFLKVARGKVMKGTFCLHPEYKKSHTYIIVTDKLNFTNIIIYYYLHVFLRMLSFYCTRGTKILY